MTSYEFEKAAKQALAKKLNEEYDEDFVPRDISMVWFGYIIGNMKGLFIDNGANNRYYEVTYNRANDEMYIDIYMKVRNFKIPIKEFEKG